MGEGDAIGGGEKWLNCSRHILKALLDRSNMKDECQREFKDDIKIFGLNKYKG